MCGVDVCFGFGNSCVQCVEDFFFVLDVSFELVIDWSSGFFEISFLFWGWNIEVVIVSNKVVVCLDGFVFW